MTKLRMHPRLMALLYVVGGGLIVSLIAALGGMNTSGRGSNKIIFLFGMAGIAAGVGLTQLIWPPKVPENDDDRSGWQRAAWPQKILWILGGCVGVVAAAVTQVVLTGKI